MRSADESVWRESREWEDEWQMRTVERGKKIPNKTCENEIKKIAERSFFLQHFMDEEGVWLCLCIIVTLKITSMNIHCFFFFFRFLYCRRNGMRKWKITFSASSSLPLYRVRHGMNEPFQDMSQLCLHVNF